MKQLQLSHIDGIVLDIGYNEDVQNFVFVQTDNESQPNVKFVHLVEVFVKIGDIVKVGDSIGYFE